ncbi:type II toxin-antitoxin system Phd/YefM family antitoxin [Nocardiopsis sp. CNT-189]|uniref:type II toxin-antitoxin system Phd/YefM family antitoxin n=1 Tax=Nocardiopsis oceanisediminis TaxID=2816862 RepID=UPI003B30DC19
MDETMSIREFRSGLAKAIDAAAQEGSVTVVTRDGKPVGAFVPMFMLEKLEEWEDEQLAKEAEQIQAESSGRTYSMSEVMAEIMGEAHPGDAA